MGGGGGGGGGPNHRGTSPRSPDEFHLSTAPYIVTLVCNLYKMLCKICDFKASI